MKTSIFLEQYYKMMRIRMIEEAIATKYSEQKMRCPVHLSIGQEAVAVGVSEHLEASDYVVSNHRAHAHYLAKGGDLKAMIAEIYGKATGCSQGRGGSMHLVDLSVGFLGSTPIVGGSLPVAVGAAFGSKLKKEERITVIYIGEGATEEGVFMESLNFAALHKLKILFVCENNLYSVYSPLHVRQPESRKRTQIAKAHGFQTWEGDGMDIEAASELSKEAIDYVRGGFGPAFIELCTYRYREHCGPNFDQDLGYRPQEEFDFWLERDPLKVFLKKRRIDNLEEESFKKEIAEEIESAFDYALQSPFPKFDVTREDLYANH